MDSEREFRELASGLGFLEGPVATEDGRVIFTDIEAGTLLVVDPESRELETFAEVGGGPNGLAPGPDGTFFVCNNGGKAYVVGPNGYKVGAPEGTVPRSSGTPGIQRVGADGSVEYLYTECDGNPFVHPNDLVFDSEGGFYFTETGDPQGRLCDLGGIYYGKADGSGVYEILRNSAAAVPVSQPNGIGISPDGSLLYVAETASGRLWSWAIEGPGKIASLPPEAPLSRGGHLVYGAGGYALFDSLAVEASGNVCIGTLVEGGITTVSPEGELVDFLAVPEFDPFVTNVCFGGEDRRTAYITSSGLGKLWQVDWPRPGLSLNHNA